MNWLKKVLRNLLKTHMPRDLVLVRHGQSDGNWAMDLIRKGRYSEIPTNMHGVPGWQWRLTETGVAQAIATGNWMRQECLQFDTAMVSPYIRAIETAFHLRLPNEWRFRLEPREREYGTMDYVPYPDELEENMRLRSKRKSNPLFWSPPGGESIVQAMARVDRLHQTLHREHENDSVVVVCHGETILASILLLCRLTPEDFYEMRGRNDNLLEIKNCQVVQFTRVNPENGRVSEHLDWVRSSCPSKEGCGTDTGWMGVNRKLLGRSSLESIVARYPRYSG